MSNTLKLVLRDRWFEEIKSGRKNHEYREDKLFWQQRLIPIKNSYELKSYGNWDEIEPYLVEFQKAFRKNPERMTFYIKDITWLSTGKDTDLKCDCPVYDIELGERVK